jgi:chromosome segregation ATPase
LVAYVGETLIEGSVSWVGRQFGGYETNMSDHLTKARRMKEKAARAEREEIRMAEAEGSVKGKSEEAKDNEAIKALKKQIAAITKDIAAMKKDLADINADIDSETKKQKSLEFSIDWLNKQNPRTAGQEMQLKTLTKRNEDAKASIAENQALATQMREAIAASEAKIVELKAEIEKVKTTPSTATPTPATGETAPAPVPTTAPSSTEIAA